MDAAKVAGAVVERIITDLSSRASLGDAWDERELYQDDIRKTWIALAKKEIEDAD